ncbi:Uncharacterized protein HZ326_6460 [Fusarium oxysporum f. sp. albedinis]|nr:Uncharacterized protein HZ326_6460 [Fusarium oxysporum f. sp. albedinis]
MVFSFPTWLPASLESLSFCVDFVKGRATQVCKQSTEQVTQQLLEVTAPLLTFNTEKSSRNPALWCFIMVYFRFARTNNHITSSLPIVTLKYVLIPSITTLFGFHSYLFLL